MNICVFCASGNNVGEPYISAVKELGKTIGERGHNLVFGGYDTGLMGVVSHAVHDAGGSVIGVVPEGVDKFQEREVFDCDDLYEVSDISRRKDVMTEKADAYIAAPGGYGTLDELYQVLVEQKLSSERKKPIAIYNVEGYFNDILKMADNIVSKNMAPAEDLDLSFAESDPEVLVSTLEKRL